MTSRSRSFRPGARGMLGAGVVGVLLVLELAGPGPAGAQESKAPARGAIPGERPSLEARLLIQRLATRRARAAYEIARLNREVAEIAVDEYAEGTYLQEMATVEGEIALARSDLVRCEDRADWAERMFRRGFVSKATTVSEQRNHEKAKYELERALSRKKVLVGYTREKTIKTLKANVEKARKDEADQRAAWESAVIRLAELERQLDRI